MYSLFHCISYFSAVPNKVLIMKPLVFNFTGSRFDRRMEAIALKAGYLLADNPIIAGSTPKEIYVRNMLDDLPVMRKLQMLIGFYKDDPEYHNAFTQMYQTMKEAAKVKHKKKN